MQAREGTTKENVERIAQARIGLKTLRLVEEGAVSREWEGRTKTVVPRMRGGREHEEEEEAEIEIEEEDEEEENAEREEEAEVWRRIADIEDRIRGREAEMALRRTTITAIRQYLDTIRMVLLSWELRRGGDRRTQEIREDMEDKERRLTVVETGMEEYALRIEYLR
jgi:hypothetical protein